MPTYIVNWTPKRWPWTGLPKLVAETRAGEMPVTRWSTGNRKNVETGDRIFLMRHSNLRGLMGSGFAASDSYAGPHWEDDRDDSAQYVEVRWDMLLAPAQRLPVEQLLSEDFGVPWNNLMGSGVHVSEEATLRLEELWEDHLRGIGRLQQTLPEELPSLARFKEGAAKQILVNAYERNACARQECIDKLGLDCSACGFNFAAFYGEAGEGYIHVHHLRDVATIGEEYQVDPVKDLRPVCPNCHAMLHRTTPAMSIEALREIIRRQSSGT